MVWHHEGVSEMPVVVEEYRSYKQTDLDALKMRFRARARLGAVILRERKARNATQDDVAAELGLVTNQVRRYEQAARQWAKEYPGESLD